LCWDLEDQLREILQSFRFSLACRNWVAGWHLVHSSKVSQGLGSKIVNFLWGSKKNYFVVLYIDVVFFCNGTISFEMLRFVSFINYYSNKWIKISFNMCFITRKNEVVKSDCISNKIV
jgi:hypothetical protein